MTFVNADKGLLEQLKLKMSLSPVSLAAEVKTRF